MSEHRIAGKDDLKDGEMKEVEVAGTKILLVRLEDGYHALYHACPHKGAPLVEGSLHGRNLRCPWHQAVFDAATGALKEPCSLDSVPSFEVRVEGDEVIVSLPDEVPEAVTPEMSQPDTSADGRTFIIVGTGAAGMAAAETMRSKGFQGRIVMLTREGEMPYHRPDLSKWYLGNPEEPKPYVRTKEFYDEHGIEVLLNAEVVSVDAGSRKIILKDGSGMEYDRLLLATGSVPRRLPVPGADLGKVFTLRSLEDCDRIREAATEGSRAVVIGASFIGMETAAALTGRGVKVTVVAPDEVPFISAFGKDIGQLHQNEHQKNGVEFRLGHTVARLEGDGEVEAAVLDDGERLGADMVIVGIGVVPATGYLKGLDLNEDGSITVDEHMRVTDEIYAAGDIARFPDWRTGEPIRIEHWRHALQLGRVAGSSMAGGDMAYNDVPFFWSFQFDLNAKYVGYTRGWDEIIFEGVPAEGNFVGFYLKDGKVEAASASEQTVKINLIAEVLSSPDKPTLPELRKRMVS